MVRGLNASNVQDLGWLAEFSKGDYIKWIRSSIYCSTLDRFPKTLLITTIIQIQGVWEHLGIKYTRCC